MVAIVLPFQSCSNIDASSGLSIPLRQVLHSRQQMWLCVSSLSIPREWLSHFNASAMAPPACSLSFDVDTHKFNQVVFFTIRVSRCIAWKRIVFELK